MSQRPSIRRRPALLLLYAVVLLDLIGFGALLPLLPFHAETLGASGLDLGLLLTSYSAAQLLGAALLGRLSDRLGRRPILLLSLAGSVLGFVLTAVAPNLVWLALARGLAGLFGGSIAVAQAVIADLSAPPERARFLGLLGAAIGTAFVLGPAVGVALSGTRFMVAALGAAGFSAAAFLLVLLRLPESRPGGRGASTPRARSAFGALGAALRRPALRRLLVAIFLITFAFAAMEATYAYLGKARFGLDQRAFGIILVAMGTVAIAVQGGAIGRLARRFGEARVATAGTVLMGLALAAVPFAPTLALAVLSLATLSLGKALALPNVAALVSRASGAAEQGSTLGLGQSMTAAARSVGPLVAGALYDLEAAWPYALAAALALAASALLSTVRREPAAAGD